MSELRELASEYPLATDGKIAVINLESARRRAWTRFWQDPCRLGFAELIVEQEQQAAQFLGDLSALDRLEMLAAQLTTGDAPSGRTVLIQARVAGGDAQQARDIREKG